MITSSVYGKTPIGLEDRIAFTLILTFQISSFFTSKISLFVLGILAIALVFVCFIKNKFKVINISFIVWWYGFILVSLFSIAYSVSTMDSIGRFWSILFSLLFLGSLSQYVKSEESVKRLLNYYTIGGLLFILINLITNISFIISADLVNLKFGMEFSYISIQTMCIVIWKFIYSQKYRSYYFLLILFLISMILISGNKKSIILPIVFVSLIILIRNRKDFGRLLLSIFMLLSTSILLFYVIMNNDILYSVLGQRIEGLLNFFTGFGTVDKSTTTRMGLIDKAIEVFFNNPLTGVGLDGFKKLNIYDVYVHNNFLELLAGLGLLGFIAYYWIYVYLLVNLFRFCKNKSNSVAILLFSLVLTLLVNWI